MVLSSTTRRYLVRLTILAVLAGALLYVMMTGHTLERMFIYFPTREVVGDPSQLGFRFEDVWMQTEDGVRIHGWFIPSAASTRTILIFHGNAGNIGHRLPWIDLLQRLPANVFIIDYRGYGRSDGQPFEAGLYRDARAAWDWWHREKRPPAGSCVLLGESLGGAVAIHLAARVPCAGVIVQSTFSSGHDMAQSVFPLGLLRPLAGVRFDSAAEIGSVRAPKLFIHGEQDEIVPFQLGRKLFDVAPPPKDFFAVPGAHHNDLVWVGGADYQRRLKQFLDSLPQ